ADIDALVAEVVANTNSMEFDVTNDGLVTFADVQQWLLDVGSSQGIAIVQGDANLDGLVDVSDFNLWNRNKFTSGNAWCGGDFNADGNTDVGDFNLWNQNKFGGPFAVPEPGLPLSMIVLLGFMAEWRRRVAGVRCVQ
ncbi:MAG: hypothetical protein AAF497_04055, partial [Planctomycetota bacterium]